LRRASCSSAAVEFAIYSFKKESPLLNPRRDRSPSQQAGHGVEIALGNGDGTFKKTSASPNAVPSELYSLVAGGFNHDGKMDLAGVDSYNDRIVLPIGAGEGRFAVTATTLAVSQAAIGPFAIVAADFNGDGVPDLVMLTKYVGTATILLTDPTQPATSTVNGLAPLGAGNHNVEASYAADSPYGASVSTTVALTAAFAPLVISPASGAYTTGHYRTNDPHQRISAGCDHLLPGVWNSQYQRLRAVHAPYPTYRGWS